MSEHELWNELGNLYFMTGTYQQAAYAYNRSIQLDTGFGRPYCNLALTYVKQGRYAEAVQLYQHSIELLMDETEKAITWYRLGDVYRHLKNYRDAIMAYQQADLIKPELSQDQKESGDLLYGGSGENLPANPPALQAEEEIKLPAHEVDPEPIEAAPQEPQVTETPVIEASPVMTNVTGTPLLEEAAPALVTEMVMAGETPDVQPVNETLALLDLLSEPVAEYINSAPDPQPQEEPMLDTTSLEETTGPAPKIEIVFDREEPAPIDAPMLMEEPAPVETFQAEGEVQTEAENQPEAFVEAQPEILAEAQAEAEPETQALVQDDAPEQAQVETPVLVQDEVVADDQPEAAAEIADEVLAENETLSHIEMSEPAAETISMPEEPVPATETMVNPADPDTAWIDDDYLVAHFDQETEVYPPDFSEDVLDQWLPLEPEPMPEPVQTGRLWGGEMQVAVEPVTVGMRRLPGTMIHESWEPALPLANGDMELPLAEEISEDLFIEPGEAQELEIGMEAEAEVQVEAQASAVPDLDPLQTAQELEQIENEISRWKYVVQNNPRNAAAWDNLGTLYKSARKYRDAILAYQQAVAVDPNKAPYHHHLGILYAIEGREEDAMKAFQEVIEIDPNHSLANATLGGYYKKMGLEELAQRHIGKAMKNFYNSENEYNKACLEALCGNVEQSIELLRVALKNKQTYVDWVLRDPDLDSIRRDPRFKQLIADYMV